MLKNKLLTKTAILILFMTLNFLSIPGYGQRNELGVFFGGSYYLGDLNPHQHFAMTRIAAGGLYRFNINEHFALRLNGIFASVEGNDAVVKYNETRNLSFISNVTEVSVQAEVNFLSFLTGASDTPHSPYLFGGAGAFAFNPRAELDGRYYDLQPLGTEGQGIEGYPDPYKRISYNLLFGLGYKFNITRQVAAGLEWGWRLTATDYLDDVSGYYPDPSHLLSQTSRDLSDRSANPGQNAGLQRGNPNNNDWYSFAGFLVTFRLPSFKRTSCPAYN
jgi:hypothetical protein